MLLLFGYQFICTLICFVPAAIDTLGALQSKATTDSAMMLKYWVLFGFIQLFESSGLNSWIPYYYTVRTVFLLWAWQLKGAEVRLMYSAASIIDCLVAPAALP